jgi:hypothetical protein
MRKVADYLLKDGRRLGTVNLSSVTTAVVDALYEKLLVIKETDADGNVIERQRRTTVNHARKTCRRAWNVVSRVRPGKVPTVNPFAKMRLVSSDLRHRPRPSELQAFRAKAIELGLASLATGALIGWEWLQREIDIFATFEVAHYRPNAVRAAREDWRAELGSAVQRTARAALPRAYG